MVQLGEVDVQNSFSIYIIYGKAGCSPDLVALFATKFLFCLFSALSNFNLFYVTWTNLKSLSSSCHLLLGASGLVNGLMCLNSGFALYITLIGRNFMPVLHCTLGQTLFFWAYCCSSFLTFSIGIDRLLSVLAPFWYTKKEKDSAQKKAYLASCLGICSLFSLLFVGVIYKATFDHPNTLVICTIGDPMQENIGWFVLLLDAISALTVLCYLGIWLAIRVKDELNEQNRAVFKSLFLIVLLEVLGWITNYSIRTILAPISTLLQITPLTAWFVMNLYAIVPYIAVGVGPFILFKFSKEYRRAFQRQWGKGGGIVGAGQKTGAVAVLVKQANVANQRNWSINATK